MIFCFKKSAQPDFFYAFWRFAAKKQENRCVSQEDVL